MNGMSVETYDFLQNFVLPAQKLCDISEVEGHYFYIQLGMKFFFKRREFPSLKGIEQDQETAKNVLEHTTESLRNQLIMSQADLSKYIMRYESVTISYPFACFIHQPILNNLSNFIKNPLTFAEKVSLMIGIAQGIDDLHSKDIRIRTLRPSTIILTQCLDGKYSIVFSDARSLECLDKDKKLKVSKIKQTNPYMAPELNRQKIPTLSCDIWSLGLIYYEIFFGKTINFSKLEQKGVIQYPQGSSRWVQNFLEKLIAREPKNRYYIKDIIRFLNNASLCSKLSKNCLY